MSPLEAMQKITIAINNSPRNGYIAELHLQVIKYADLLEDVTGKEFCLALGIGSSFGTEFSKMKRIAKRLVKAGLDVAKI
jgi:phenylalanyl-tRNA synthetase beta subunit